MLRTASLAVLLIVLLVGCGETSGGSSNATGNGTDLTMVALNPNVGRAVFHLRCSPAGGDFSNAAKACAALGDKPELVTDPEPFTCIGGLFSWWDITIRGELDGKSIERAFSTCWTPQMETLRRFDLSWESLEAHLVPRREETVLAGEEEVFPPGALRATDLVSCDILGHHLEVGVPVEANGQPSSTGWQGANVETVTLAVALSRDGSVSASCHRGE